VTDIKDLRRSPQEHAGKAIGRELGAVFKIEIGRPPVSDRVIDTGDFKAGEWGDAEPIRGKGDALEEAQRIHQMLQHMTADQQIRVQLTEMIGEIEKFSTKLQECGTFRSTVRIETHEAAGGAQIGQSSEETSVTVADLNDGRTLAQVGQKALVSFAEQKETTSRLD